MKTSELVEVLALVASVDRFMVPETAAPGWAVVLGDDLPRIPKAAATRIVVEHYRQPAARTLTPGDLLERVKDIRRVAICAVDRDALMADVDSQDQQWLPILQSRLNDVAVAALRGEPAPPRAVTAGPKVTAPAPEAQAGAQDRGEGS